MTKKNLLHCESIISSETWGHNFDHYSGHCYRIVIFLEVSRKLKATCLFFKTVPRPLDSWSSRLHFIIFLFIPQIPGSWLFYLDEESKSSLALTSPRSSLEIQNLGPIPGLLNQALHFNKSPRC